MESKRPHHSRPEQILHRLCDISAALGGLILIGIACMTVISVIGRSFFSHPILGDVELVQLGCAVVVACFLPFGQFQRANIIVDFFSTNASERAQAIMDTAGTLLYTLVMALVCWRVAAGGFAIHEAQETSMLMNLPLWIPYLLMVPGLALCVVIGLQQTVAQTTALLEKRA